MSEFEGSISAITNSDLLTAFNGNGGVSGGGSKKYATTGRLTNQFGGRLPPNNIAPNPKNNPKKHKKGGGEESSVLEITNDLLF
jgi:hypothetical protein